MIALWLAALPLFLAAPPALMAQPAVTMTPETFVADAVGVRDVELSPFGTYVAIYDQTEGNTIRMFDADLRQLWRRRLPFYWAGRLSPGSVIQFAADESFLLLPGGRTENDVCVCDPATGEPLQVLQAHENSVDDIGLSPDGRWLLTSSYNELILWEWEGGTFAARQVIREFDPATHSIEFLADSERVAVSTSRQMLRAVTIYRVTGGKLEREFRHEFSDNNISHEIDQLAVSPDGEWLAAGYRDSVLFFAVTDSSVSLAHRITGMDVGNVSGLTFSPDGRHLVTGHFRYVKWWRWSGSSWEETATHPTQQPVIHDLEISQDGRLLYVASRADENALARFSLDGVGRSSVGAITSTLGGVLSTAQRRVLTPALAARIVRDLGEDALAPRDMFETADEYEARMRAARAHIVEALLDAVELRYDAERVDNSAAVYDVRVPLQSQGSYDIDRQRYSLGVMDAQAWLHLDRSAARSLYQQWQEARLRATRFTRDGVPGYADFRLDHPDGARQYPLVLEQNPFTGERLNTAGSLVPAVAVGPHIVVRNLEVDGIFPTLYPRYATDSFGRFTVENTGTGIVSELSATFSIAGLTGGTHGIALPQSLAAGREASAALSAPVDASVLESTEGGTATLTLNVSYRRGDAAFSQQIARQIRVLNRNAIQWNDDRRIGAFMTVSHPAVLGWAGQVAGAVEIGPTPALTRNLLYAMQLYQSLAAAGINYVIDPNSAYAALSGDGRAVDFLRFPAETLAQGAGDCDDLAALYATLLESVGVPTAFITTPGHIFVAFDTGMTETDARATFAAAENLIVTGGKVWMPVETTILEQGFTRAWQTGALQWRQAYASGTAGFFTTQEAWGRYSPVAPALVATPSAPPLERVRASVAQQLAAFREIELEPRLRRLATESGVVETPAVLNQRGVLYAVYGLLDRAAEQFQLALAAGDYVPALINQANVMGIRGRHEEARADLERARHVDPENPRVLMGLAFSFWESGNQTEARSSYEVASRMSPNLARRYPLFTLAGTDGGERAGTGPSIYSQDWAEEP